jgi:small subunit ribosomal protein S13
MPVVFQKKKELRIEYAPLDKALLEKKRRELRIPKPKKRENIVYLIDKKENKKEPIITILKKIVGCGLAPAKYFPKLLGIPYNKTRKIHTLNADQTRMYTDLLQKYNFDFEAKDESEIQNRLRLDRIKPLRQWRYLNRLPCRGQRTKTNAQTAKSRFKVKHEPRTGIADKLRKSDIQNNRRINE